MNYEVQVVADDELPEGVSRVIVEREGAPPLLLLCGEPARTWLFMRSYEDTLEPWYLPTVCLPPSAPAPRRSRLAAV